MFSFWVKNLPQYLEKSISVKYFDVGFYTNFSLRFQFRIRINMDKTFVSYNMRSKVIIHVKIITFSLCMYYNPNVFQLFVCQLGNTLLRYFRKALLSYRIHYNFPLPIWIIRMTILNNLDSSSSFKAK